MKFGAVIKQPARLVSLTAPGLTLLMLVAAVSGCAISSTSKSTFATSPAPIRAAPADRFLAALAVHCVQAFAGRVLIDTPASTAPSAFAGKPLVMHVRGCDDPAHELHVPFHVGDDHSRTWVLTRTATGLRLKHDHRHADGSADALTQYGGATIDAGSANRQEFPVDAESIALFKRLGSIASLSNTWAMEIQPGRSVVYQLSRPGGRLFRVEFDLTQPVALPPAPWGS
ncbi:hypothetical protein NY667_22385 [Xanthomonas hortorum pv. hederae]|uniref:Secreted protein n=1 Tax=Xanthomonas hortorum pv. hederae TaxID=453603 RepID=A0A9X4BVQ6_9XANT|nr:hypothetical protein [Xanthomonas hortorum]MCE4372035.1 hypothetical protein [Xanthomonas hortorum pv. hederae]MDC8640471.1 hypothetical protein [Xanthomonas hortorum pv. hederae]PPU79477.1 hypothetical protein XhhCFBP4925_14530 [Xanthomonas hortorum pv. hederae]PUE99507.1 hypothetical protein C7T87_13380 [Xanthomonas hortorum pv. hederae]